MKVFRSRLATAFRSIVAGLAIACAAPPPAAGPNGLECEDHGGVIIGHHHVRPVWDGPGAPPVTRDTADQFQRRLDTAPITAEQVQRVQALAADPHRRVSLLGIAGDRSVSTDSRLEAMQLVLMIDLVSPAPPDPLRAD